MYDTIHLTFPRRYDIDTYLQLNIGPDPYLLLDDGLQRGGVQVSIAVGYAPVLRHPPSTLEGALAGRADTIVQWRLDISWRRYSRLLFHCGMWTTNTSTIVSKKDFLKVGKGNNDHYCKNKLALFSILE